MDARQAEYLKLLGIQAWCKQEDLPIIQSHLRQGETSETVQRAAAPSTAQAPRARLQDQMASLFDERPSERSNLTREVSSQAKAIAMKPASEERLQVASLGAEQSTSSERSRAESRSSNAFQVEVAPKAPEKIAVKGPFTPTPYQFPVGHSIYTSEFAESIQQCRGCEFSQSRHQATLPRQYPDAPVMIITDIPLKEEMYQGLVLDRSDESFFYQALNRVGFRTEELYITPFIKCRPPELRDVDEAEWHACYAILRQEILTVKPKVIFLLGRNCVKFLLQSELPFESLRLTPHQLTFEGLTIPAVISHSPKVYARNSRLKINFWQDVKFLRRQYLA
ncbi:uracil-DNA glycosylase [Ignatzschineria cameli]|uniref:uracil-DNA glycosylase n=1 Tax=Ignatzschineria cameli TaxID=2182793 RepID=UPI000D61F6F0|nr:uracil-DNA glycosylase [Ignatzschineria cameli]PWD87593.1 hypothetical protein DC080_01895 [Ignatzschineria cameli]